jgi:multiple sugar transport system permease protein/raffinose/stachyose/melibiose transport system permease protein
METNIGTPSGALELAGRPHAGKRTTASDRAVKRWSYSALAGPALVIYGVVVIVPVLVSFVVAFFNWDGFGSATFVGFDNYAKLFADPAFWWDVRNNLLVVLISLLGQIPLGFVLAYIIFRRIVRNGSFYETMIFLPITISSIIVAILWNRMFSPTGVLVELMRDLTHDPRWVFSVQEDKYWAMVPVLFVILWQFTGLYLVIFLANMQKINRSTIEAALLDGATEWQILRRVVAPNLWGVIFTCSVLAISGSLKSFDLIWAMTAGGPARYTEVLGIYLYQATFHYAVNPYGMGGAASVVIILISVFLIKLVEFLFRTFTRKLD